ncbi:hypothetical protein PENFLA_c043G02908 [Penicillium flavigenum]|uniref:Nucleoside phosphorylase domain-containing protein n=1 Tax=Penicillium flavigenum TaxID=254877 RepID=A0A1V6SJT0_9EURO|nr:hypothetical protein PENFLA_c043G02908 [Penicillium flavigenum]
MASLSTLDSPDYYEIAWIAALHIERAAAEAMLDKEYAAPTGFTRHQTDANVYTWGRVGDYNIVIASLAARVYGTTSVATTASSLLASLPSIRVGLLVGIGGGITRPDEDHDIRLGDVVVKSGDKRECKGFLGRPPTVLLNALSRIQAYHERKDSKVPYFLQEMLEKNPKMGPNIHYGMIASGNTLVKDAAARDRIVADIGEDCICFEMEAAGLMNHVPCLMIRGICDYADAYKNDRWQRYASATAAAYTKELLAYVLAAEGGEYGNALQAASWRGYKEIVKLLLDNGADVNAQGGEYGNALQAASSIGHEEIAKLLLDNGADVNAQGGYGGNALKVAVVEGHQAIIDMLQRRIAMTLSSKRSSCV